MAENNDIPEPAEEPKEDTPVERNESAEQPAVETPPVQEATFEQPKTVQESTGSKETNKDARMWGMICHLAGLGGLIPIVPIIGSVIGPLIVWQIKKDEFNFVADQGKESVNFQISILMYAIVSGLLCFACVGFVLLPAVYIFDLIFLLIAAVKANDGEHYRYPLTFRFIK
ncbi:MAG: DUF4870 domain-containing protein [Sedimentisphaerales bacterium]|nr:DUF4870 domain-containing protein [Sedimentisphaerales bacterium]